ncbi:MAG: DUF3667 domain-containing protein [Vicinamibacterales bacterium]
MSTGGTCANCHAVLTGAYCAQCGQHESASHPATLAHLAHELTHELLHVDGKIWRTVKALFLQPGRLTQEYWTGQRAAWIGPFRIFLIAAGLHALFVPGIGPMNLQTLVQRSPTGTLRISMGTAAETQRGAGGATALPPEELADYVGRLRRAYLSVRYAAVPLFALASLAVYRKRQAYYAGHVVLAVHFYSVWYFLGLATSRLPNQVDALAGIALSAPYLFLVLRRLFRDGPLATLGRTLLLYGVMVTLEMLLAFAAIAIVVRDAG